jgi:carboxyl-terminal processing protease
MLPPKIRKRACVRVLLVLFCGLVLCLASACVPQPILPEGFATAGPGGTRGIGYAYSLIRNYAYEDIAPSDLAEAGLRGLIDTDAAFRVERNQAAVKLFFGDKPVYEFVNANDRDWSASMAAAVVAAKAASPAYAKLFDIEQQGAVIKGMLSRVSGLARYVRPMRANPTRINPDIGFGAMWVRRGDRLIVSGVAEDGAAARAGVEVGDAIVAIDGRAVNVVDDDWIKDRLILPPSRPTILRMMRKNYNFAFRLEFNNRSLPMDVSWNDGVVVIRLPRVEMQAVGSFGPEALTLRLMQLINQYGADKLRGLVLDLRGNKGGRLLDSVDIADIFLPYGPIAGVRGRKVPDQVFAARDARTARSPLEQVPLVVLVDGFTAAGGEIIAGAVQSRQRGVIIGNTTSGFAHVDSVFSLARANLAGSIIFPTGRITLPGNQALAGHGLAPTVCLADPDQPPEVRLEAGAQRMAAFAGDARVALTDAEWLSMLAVCPPDVNDSEGDVELAIADRIIRDSALYRRLIESVPPNPTNPGENINVPAR